MATSGTVKLKLLIDTKRQKVLFAEAGKDFVDFLFTLPSLPAGTIIRLLSKDAMVGSFGKLYESVETLDEDYLQPNLNRDMVLKPKEPAAAGPNILGLTDANVNASARKTIYMCSNVTYHYSSTVHRYVSEDPEVQCPACNYKMSTPMTFLDSPKTAVQTVSSGYVKGLVTYMILDDLEVKPLSTISGITLLNRFNVRDISVLEERVVNLGLDEGVKLLKAALQSKSVLTDVFLRGNADPAKEEY